MAKKIIKMVVNVFKTFLALVIVLFVGFVILQRTTNNNFTVMGYRMFAVVTGSMEPVYKVGDVLLCKTVDPDTLKVGDDVTYLGKEASFKDKVITHRIEKIENKNGKKIFYTKGVASKSIDPPIEGNQIYGTVARKLVILSFFHKYSSGNMGFFFFVVIPIMLLVGTEIVQSMLEKYEKKNSKSINNNNNSLKENNNIQQQQQVQQQQVEVQKTEQELQQELQSLQQQVVAQQQIQIQAPKTEAELQQELQALQEQVAQQQQQLPTEQELQQELQTLQQQVAAQQNQAQ